MLEHYVIIYICMEIMLILIQCPTPDAFGVQHFGIRYAVLCNLS